MLAALGAAVVWESSNATVTGAQPTRPTGGPYAKKGSVDHETLSFDAYLKFIEDDFLGGKRLDPKTDGRPDPRPNVRENEPLLGDLANDFDFTQKPRRPVLLPQHPR